MIHIIEEEISHPFPPSFRSPRHISMNTGKRARSPDEGGSPGDRPSKRLSLAVADVSRRALYRHMSSTPNSSRHPSEDWVQQAGGLRIDSPVYPPSEPITTPPLEDVDMAMDSEEHAPQASDNVDLEPVQMDSSSSYSHSHHQDIQQDQGGVPSAPRHSYPTRYAERMQASANPPHINVALATPVNGQLHPHYPPQAQGVLNPPSAPGTGFVFSALRSSIPPPSSPVPMAISPTSSFAQLAPPSSPRTTKRRVVFGPRANCEKCRLGEKHFIHYE